MTVILNEHEISFCSGGKCNECGNSLRPPYMEWHGKVHLAFCMKCCYAIKRGFTADLIQLSAMFELKAAGDKSVLVRRNADAYKFEKQTERDAERANMREVKNGMIKRLGDPK